MSTRSVIAIPQGDQWKGRYCHSDGYPKHLLVALRTLIQRDGVERVLKVLTEEHHGWSNLNPGQAGKRAEAGLGDRAKGVRGYGVGYTDKQGIDEDDWIRSDGGQDDWNTAWAYVIYPRSIAVLKNHGDSAWELVGSVRQEDEVTDDDLRVLECGESYQRCPHYAWAHFPEAAGTNYNAYDWLALDVTEPRLGDAAEVLVGNTRLALGGSGGICFSDGTPAWRHDTAIGNRPIYWSASTKLTDGSYGGPDIIVGRRTKAGLKLKYPIVLPPNAVRGEVIIEAGTVVDQ